MSYGCLVHCPYTVNSYIKKNFLQRKFIIKDTGNNAAGDASSAQY